MVAISSQPRTRARSGAQHRKVEHSTRTRFHCPAYLTDESEDEEKTSNKESGVARTKQFQALQTTILPVPTKSIGPLPQKIQEMWEAQQCLPQTAISQGFYSNKHEPKEMKISTSKEEIHRLIGTPDFVDPMMNILEQLKIYNSHRKREDEEKIFQFVSTAKSFQDLQRILDSVKENCEKLKQEQKSAAQQWKKLAIETEPGYVRTDKDFFGGIEGSERDTIKKYSDTLKGEFKKTTFAQAKSLLSKVQQWITVAEEQSQSQTDRIYEYSARVKEEAAKANDRISKCIESINTKVTIDMDQIKKLADKCRKSEEKKSEEKKEADNNAKVVIQPPIDPGTPPAPESIAGGLTTKAPDTENVASVVRTDSSKHKEFAAIRTQYMKLAEPLRQSTVADVKRRRFGLKRDFNSAINKIANTRRNISGCVASLVKTLSTVDGGDPSWRAFAYTLLAELFVGKAFAECHVNLKTAYPLAAVCVGVFAQYADMLPILLAECHAKCPYTIAHYPVVTEGMSKEQHNTLVCKRDNETNEQHIERMGGCVRLYAAICQTDDISGSVNPHGIHNGWSYIARNLNSHPRGVITADILFKFLETAGYKLSLTYKSQFNKMVLCIENELLPLLKTGPPVSRLRTFLADLKNGNVYCFPHPDGRTPD
eukprot:CFRG4923T1